MGSSAVAWFWKCCRNRKTEVSQTAYDGSRSRAGVRAGAERARVGDLAAAEAEGDADRIETLVARARAEAGRQRIAGNLDRAVAKGRLSAADRDATLERVEATSDLGRVSRADLVVEAVFEDVD